MNYDIESVRNKTRYKSTRAALRIATAVIGGAGALGVASLAMAESYTAAAVAGAVVFGQCVFLAAIGQLLTDIADVAVRHDAREEIREIRSGAK